MRGVCSLSLSLSLSHFAQARLSTWSREKLAADGLLVTHLACGADAGELFREKLVTLTPINEGYFDVVCYNKSTKVKILSRITNFIKST
jgi:hypothetical protein